MKTEPSRVVPGKLTANLELLIAKQNFYVCRVELFSESSAAYHSKWYSGEKKFNIVVKYAATQRPL